MRVLVPALAIRIAPESSYDALAESMSAPLQVGQHMGTEPNREAIGVVLDVSLPCRCFSACHDRREYAKFRLRDVAFQAAIDLPLVH
jgi:hypothetical protein